jgi:FAD-linked sulfhydryl oxidase
MAADDTEPQPGSAPAAADSVAPGASAITTTEPPKKFPKGVVLGKDGKPYVSRTLPRTQFPAVFVRLTN